MRQILSDPRAREKPCLRCGRSLKQNLDDRHCPDCGLSLWISLNPNDSLEWSKASWLSTAARGAWILTATQVLAMAAYLVAAVGYLAGEMQAIYADVAPLGALESDYDPLPSTVPTTQSYQEAMAESARQMSAYYAQTSIPITWAAILIGVYFIANSVGLWLLSADEKRYPDRTRSHRLAARIVCGISVVVGSAMIAVAITRLQSGWPVHTWPSWFALVVCELTFVAAGCCSWLILRRVARRSGKGSLAKLCGYLLFLPAIAFAKALPIYAIWIFALLRPLANLLPLAYIPLSVYLFIRFALMLQRAVPEAEKAWASETKAH